MNRLTFHLKTMDRVALDMLALKSVRFSLTQEKTLSPSALLCGRRRMS